MARSFQRPLPAPAPGEGPVNAIPAPILLLALGMALVEAALSLGGLGALGGPDGIGWRVGLLERLAWSPAALDLLAQRAWGHGGLWLRLLAYPLVHGDVVHALFGVALLLALGKFVGEAIGGWRALGVLLAGSVGGALGFGALVGGTAPLFGAFPGVYGLIGGFTYLLWVRIGQAGGNRLGAFRLIGALLAIQLVLGLLFGASPTWVADVAGFAFGGLMAIPLAPGGLARLRARLRAR